MVKYKRGSLALARRVFNTPQLVIESDLQRISQYLVDRANGIEIEVEKPEALSATVVELNSKEDEKTRKLQELGITNEGKRGNLFIDGTLVAKATEFDAECMGIVGYNRLLDTFQKQVEMGINELVLHLDSGGGEAYSCFEMAAEVRQLADDNNIRVITYVDGLAASAAYAWASIADEIVARPDAEVGSIGVVVQLINNSKMLENIGITRKFITYGENKVPFDDKGEFTDKFINSLQKKVDKTGLEFTSFVAKNRNMKVEDVIATQAEVFDSEEALKLGLIDKVMTRSEFFNEYLPSLKSHSNNQFNLKQENNMTEKTDVTVAELQAQLETATTDKTNLQAQYDALSIEKEGLVTDLASLQAKYDALVTENEKQAELNKVKVRTDAFAEHLGKDNEQLSSLVEATKDLSDEQFNLVLSGYATNVDKTAKSMTEVGDEGQESNIQTNLEKEKQQTLADRIAAHAKQA